MNSSLFKAIGITIEFLFSWCLISTIGQNNDLGCNRYKRAFTNTAIATIAMTTILAKCHTILKLMIINYFMKVILPKTAIEVINLTLTPYYQSF